MKQAIEAEVFKGSAFSQEELQRIAAAFVHVELKKGDKVLSQGDTVLYTHFVASGCLRSYFIDKTGKEHTLQFAVQDWWISDYTAFFTAGKAQMYIECIQEARIYKLSRKNMLRLYTEIPPFESFFRKKLEGRFTALQKRVLGNLSLSAKDRYLSFLKTYPNIEPYVKNYHIASFLGITTESLSRIRKDLVP